GHSGGRRDRAAGGRLGRVRSSSCALTLAARLRPVMGGVKNHYPFHLVNQSPTKCRLPPWAGVDIIGRRRGDRSPCSEDLSPGARGRCAPRPHGGPRTLPSSCCQAARGIFPISPPPHRPPP